MVAKPSRILAKLSNTCTRTAVYLCDTVEAHSQSHSPAHTNRQKSDIYSRLRHNEYCMSENSPVHTFLEDTLQGHSIER